MPNNSKNVRFAQDSKKYYPAGVPALPLAPSTTSSNPPRPPTPLPISYNPHHFSRLHPLLDASGIGWNMLDDFSTTTRHNPLFPNQVLFEQATNPPIPFITIASLHLPWFIEVYASNGSYVSVGDVFGSIYSSLRTNITTSDFLCLPKRDQVGATRAYEYRYRRFRKIYGSDGEKQAGMKRIDLLMSHTMFQGISNSGNSGQWQLCPTT